MNGLTDSYSLSGDYARNVNSDDENPSSIFLLCFLSCNFQNVTLAVVLSCSALTIACIAISDELQLSEDQLTTPRLPRRRCRTDFIVLERSH